jgi:UDPglucose--hexose-1-phosphate uridylyltransferase
MSDKKLPANIVRTDREMSDGRTIRYYDSNGQTRTAQDLRPVEPQPQIGELRYDSLVGEWVVIAAHRQNRIFLPPKELCPLCPTSENPGDLLTEIPEASFEVVVFDNRGPSFRAPNTNFELPEALSTQTAEGVSAGKCEVICFAAEHGKSLKDLSPTQVRVILEAWKDRVRELSQLSYIAHIAPFENRGEEVGVTLSHPHGQIYAYPFIPPRVEKSFAAAKEHLARTGKVLLDDVVAREIKDEERIVARNEHWVAYVPYAARYPFEIHLAPIKSVADLAELGDAASAAFPEIALEILNRLDGVFGIEMAYIAAWHQAPVRVGRDSMRLHWQITSVRRQPGKLKYLAGSESAMGAFIMDLKPEQSAAQLREVKL